MLCPRCGTILEGRFCHTCGFDAFVPAYVCPRCGGGFAGFVCPYCGLPVGAMPYAGPTPGAGARAVGSVVWSIAMVLFVVLLVAELATLAYTSGLVVNGSQGSGPFSIDLYVLVPYPWGASYDVPTTVFLAYYGLLVLAIVSAHLYYLIKEGRLTARTFARPIEELRPRLEARGAFFATGQVFLAIFLFQSLYLFVLWLTGFVPEVPTFPGTMPEWYPYYALANASVYEEFATRWLYIGVPLFLGAALLSSWENGRTPRGNAVPLWRHLFGGTITRDSPLPLLLLAGVLVVFSSVVFGLAHVPSWGWWKFPPTMVAGVALGYLFLRSGLFAAILFHFATDYLAAMALLAEGNLGAQAGLGLLILVMIALGAFFFAWYFVYAAGILNHIVGGAKLQPQAVAAPIGSPAPPPPYVPAPAPAPERFTIPPYGIPPVSFVCPSCGWREARLEEGRFTCLRCGRVS